MDSFQSILSIADASVVVGVALGSGILWKFSEWLRARYEEHSKAISRLQTLVDEKIEISNQLSDVRDGKKPSLNVNHKLQLEKKLRVLELEEKHLISLLPRRVRKEYLGMTLNFVRPAPVKNLRYLSPNK